MCVSRNYKFNPSHNQSVVFCILLVILLLFTVSLTATAEESIRIGGTGGALGVMKLLSSEFKREHPSISVAILPSMGSSGGIEAVRAGALEIGLSTMAMTGMEQDLAAYVFGRTPFVFAVSKTVPISGLTSREVIDIFAGKTVAWPDGAKIRIVLRPSSEYDSALLKNISEEMNEAVRHALSRRGMIVEVTDQENATALEKTPGAFGTITLAQILSEKRQIKPLLLDGLMPGRESLKGIRYPYFKTYYLVVRKNPDAAVRKFMDFIYSDRGRNILIQSGYEPIGP
jgi:phosphate transport system substrate-binding protein